MSGDRNNNNNSQQQEAAGAPASAEGTDSDGDLSLSGILLDDSWSKNKTVAIIAWSIIATMTIVGIAFAIYLL